MCEDDDSLSGGYNVGCAVLDSNGDKHPKSDLISKTVVATGYGPQDRDSVYSLPDHEKWSWAGQTRSSVNNYKIVFKGHVNDVPYYSEIQANTQNATINCRNLGVTLQMAFVTKLLLMVGVVKTLVQVQE